MALKVITGRSGVGKTTKIINEIIQKLNEDHVNESLILFVPEQMSFQAEYEIAKRMKGSGYTGLQVFSFKRLAYRLFLEVGGFNKIFINDLTIRMILTKIIEENKNRFLLYNRVSSSVSFISMVYDVLKEFKSYDVDFEALRKTQEKECDETLKKKLHDIDIIYTELMKYYGNELLDGEDFFRLLAEKIKSSRYIKQSEIYIDGYHSYTTLELNVIYNLIQYAKNVTILFTIDNVMTNHQMYQEDHLFHLPYETLEKVRQFSVENNIDINIEYITNEEPKRYKSQELAFLEKNYDTTSQYLEDVRNIKVFETENPTQEVHHMARMIYNEVLSEKNQYSDFVIYMNNQDVYYPLIKTIFPLYNIPVFVDDQKLMLDHFLLNFIDASLEIIKTNFSYSAMFRAIKTEMFFPLNISDEVVTSGSYKRMIEKYRQRIDRLENYCLSHGIDGTSWLKDTWTVDINKKLTDLPRTMKDEEQQLEIEINETKKEIMTPLISFVDQFKKAQNLQEQICSIFDYLKNLDVEQKLNLYEELDENASLLNNAKKHKQVYNKLMDLFDELIEVCGDYVIETEELIKVLQTGFKRLTFAILPPSLDQVMVGSLKRSRFELMGHFDDLNSVGVKKAFVLGVNENEIPKAINESGLITNKERQFLIDEKIEIMPTTSRAFLDEYFIIYKVLTSPSEKLYLSYTLSSHEKKEAHPSEIIDKIITMFPKIKVETIYDFPSEHSLEESLFYITSKSMSTSTLLQAVDQLRKGYPVNDVYKALYNYFQNDYELKHKLIGVTYKNTPTEINSLDVEKLYTKTINASISSVERYNSCPYAYFLERGLDLRDRDIQMIEPMDIGDLYHETLRVISERLINENKDLHDLSLGDISQIVHQIVDEFSKKMQRNYFYQNLRNQNLLLKIKNSLIQSLEVMHYQSQHSKFHILAVEEKFGFDARRLKVEPIRLTTGFEMRLKGIIDRIDVARINDNPYIRIIDYKSGNKDIDFTKIYHRLSLQLFTYLDVVLKNSKQLLNEEAHAAGVLYYHIQNSEIQASNELTLEEILRKHQEAYKMNGYTLGEEPVSQLFDQKLLTDNKSDIIKVAFTNNGYHKVQSKVLDLKSIEALRDYSYKAIVNSFEEITQGKIDIEPVLYNNQSTCKYCNYHSVCKFDAKSKENKHKEIKKSGDIEGILNQIRSEVGICE